MARPDDPAVAERVQRRLDDADRNLIGGVEAQVRVELDVGDGRRARLRRGAERRGVARTATILRELGLEAVGVLLREAGLAGERRRRRARR